MDTGNGSTEFSDTPTNPTPQNSSPEGAQFGPELQMDHWPNQLSHPTPRDNSPEGYTTTKGSSKHLPGQH